MNEQWRPPFCPDRACTPLIRPLTDSDNRDLSTDYAVFCFGRLAEPIDWTFAGVEHHETLSQCQSSPLKGNVRWLDNEADWDALASVYRMAHSAALGSPSTGDDRLREAAQNYRAMHPCSGGTHMRGCPNDQALAAALSTGAPDTEEPA